MAWPGGLSAGTSAAVLSAAATTAGQRSLLDDDRVVPPAAQRPDKPGKKDDDRDETEEPLEPVRPPADAPKGDPKEDLKEPILEDDGTAEELAPKGRAVPRPDFLDGPQRPDDEQEQTPEEEQTYDEVYWGKSTPMRVSFCPHYSKFSAPNQRHKLHAYSRSERGQAIFEIQSRQIEKVVYFEQRLGNLAAAQLGLVSLAELAEVGATVDLTDLEEEAERALRLLAKAVDEHDSAVQRRLRTGTRWEAEFRRPLLAARVNLRLGQVDLLIRQQRYQQAELLCDRLRAELAPGSQQLADLRRRVEEIFRLRAAPAYKRGDYATVRELLDRLAGRYGDKMGDTAEGIQNELIAVAGRRKNKAQELLRRAQGLADPLSPQAAEAKREAVELLKQAAEIWPSLPGLHDLRFRTDTQHPLLHCAYAELPRSLSPLDVYMPVERHAVSLVYEGLVRWVDDRHSGSHHRCQLARGRPIPLERGRAFHLPECVWSDSDARRYFCCMDDVYGTYSLLTNAGRPGYSPAFSRLIEGVRDHVQPGPFALAIRLRCDHWQPLSLMDAMILPKHHLPKAGSPEDFQKALRRLAQNPVGTGPYRLGDRGPDKLQFVANPHYRYRRQLQLPKIKEIAFHRRSAIDARNGVLAGDVHLAYGVRVRHLVELRESGARVVALRTPSVWVLAPNYRRATLRSRDLRLAIAYAVQREAILDRQFRLAGNRDDHTAVSGPYPKDSWAYNRDVRRFCRREAAEKAAERDLAGACARRAKAELKTWPVTLRLAFPRGNPETESACMQIKTQVERATEGITLELQAVQAGAFYDKIVRLGDFDLAYWRIDFPSPAFWLEPLLDQDPKAQRPGGPNFMGYTPDATLTDLFRKITGHKHFPHVQGWTHQIHEHVSRHAIVIPLWQLDTYLALSPRLKLSDSAGREVRLARGDLFGNLDLFRDVQHWQLEAANDTP